MRTGSQAIKTGELPLRALFAAGVLLAGCGGGGGGATGTAGSGGAGTSSSSSGSTSTSTSTSGSSSSGSTAITCTGQPAALSLSGTWAALGQLSVNLQGMPGGAISICPTNQVGQATILLLVTVEQDTTTPTKIDMLGATLCAVTLPSVSALVGTCDPTSAALVTTQLSTPPALIAALPKVATATTTGSLGGTSPGASITINPLSVVVGSSAAGASLPAWEVDNAACNSPNVGMTKTCSTTCVTDCTTLRDDDMDGYPGVTIDVCGFTASDTSSGVKCNAATPAVPGSTLQGQGYVDIEVNPSVTGTVTSSCEVAGNVSTEILYNLVGAQVYLAGQPITVSSAIESLPTFMVDASASQFRMVRIDGQYGAPNWDVDPTQAAAACATLNMRVNEL
jgi:hypothetical protein